MKVVVLLSRIPWPLVKGDKLRAYHHLKIISKEHDVVLVCLTDTAPHPDAIENLSPFCEEIHFIKLSKLGIVWNLATSIFNDKPFSVNYFHQKSAQKRIDKIIEKHMPRHLFVQLIRTAEYVKKYHILESTFDYMDAFSMGAQRRVAKAVPGIRTLLKIEANRLKKYENSVFNQFDNKTIISKNDRELIEHPDNNEIKLLPNGVDFTQFKPNEEIEKVNDLVFTGNMSYPPNIKAAHYLATEIMPIILKKLPNAKLVIAGASPHPSVKSLASKNVTVTGWMDNISDAYNEAKAFIAPMEIGTGMQNKILEAMAMRIPCITSKLAGDAIGASHNENILIANTPNEFAEYVFKLLSSDSLREQISSTAFDWVNNNYDWNKNGKTLLDLIATPQLKK